MTDICEELCSDIEDVLYPAISADSVFILKTQEGIPLSVILHAASMKNIRFFPWYGFARRMWDSGANPTYIVSEIKEALLLSGWKESWDVVKVELQNLWRDL
jgi:hypothetical protein